MALIEETKGVYERVKESILTLDFQNLLREQVKKGLKLYKANPELFSLVSEYTDISVNDLRPVWDKVFRLLMRIYSGRVRVKRSSGVFKARINTLANTLYFILYELYGSSATEILYSILEPYIVPSITDSESFERARLFFIPVSEGTLENTVMLLKEVLIKHNRELCKIPEYLYHGICSQTSFLPSSSNGNGGVERCLTLVTKAYREVCSNEH